MVPLRNAFEWVAVYIQKGILCRRGAVIYFLVFSAFMIHSYFPSLFSNLISVPPSYFFTIFTTSPWILPYCQTYLLIFGVTIGLLSLLFSIIWHCS